MLSESCSVVLLWFFSTSPLNAAKVFESVSCLCCLDVDECLAANGGCDHTCQNSAGSFQCFCRRGFRLDEDRQSCIREYQQSCWTEQASRNHARNMLLENLSNCCCCTAKKKIGKLFKCEPSALFCVIKLYNLKKAFCTGSQLDVRTGKNS